MLISEGLVVLYLLYNVHGMCLVLTPLLTVVRSYCQHMQELTTIYEMSVGGLPLALTRYGYERTSTVLIQITVICVSGRVLFIR